MLYAILRASPLVPAIAIRIMVSEDAIEKGNADSGSCLFLRYAILKSISSPYSYFIRQKTRLKT